MSDFLIIGGGIIGMLSARELALAGAKVRLLERGQMAKEATWAGGGILSPLYPWRYPQAVTRLASWSQQRYADFCGELLKATGLDPEYQLSGLLIQSDEQSQALAWASKSGNTMEVLSARQIKELEPELKDIPDSALWMPEIGQVRNPRFARALLADIRRLGVEIVEQRAVTAIKVDSGKALVETQQGVQIAGQILVCAGAWSRRLLSALRLLPDIQPVKGQMLVFAGEPNRIRHISLAADRYIIPRRDGHILFGSTIEHTDFDKSTTNDARAELERIAISRYPILKNYAVEKHWAGLRPGSPDGTPYIGRHPEASNLIINAGHFRNGVVLGLASARLAADIALERQPIIDAAPYGLLR